MRPHLKQEQKTREEYSSVDSVNNCHSLNSSTGSKHKLSSQSATSLSAEEEAFERCYQQAIRRSPMRAFMGSVMRRAKGRGTRSSQDSSASTASPLGSANTDGSGDFDSKERLPSSACCLEGGAAPRSYACCSDEVFEPEVGSRVKVGKELPPTTQDGKRREKERAKSTPNTQEQGDSTAHAAAAYTSPSERPTPQQIEAAAAITPDILAEIEMYRYMVRSRPLQVSWIT